MSASTAPDADPAPSRPAPRLLVLLAGLVVAWLTAYLVNERMWPVVLSDWLRLDLTARVPDALHFFLYDATKILLLLAGMMFVIGILRTTIRVERVREWLEGRGLFLGLFLAALFGAITPFCSCSSIPLFIGFVAAGIPICVTLTFLLASPLISEIAVVMLGDTFGWKVMAAYVVAGFVISMTAGWIYSRFDLEKYVADFVFKAPLSQIALGATKPTLAQRVEAAKEETRDIFTRVWKWVLMGVALGAFIHGWAPEEFFVSSAGPGNPFAVVVATLAGAPLYANAAGVVPIAEALFAKGASLGTVMAFIMGTIALSLPEAILLKQVLSPRLMAIFFGTATLAIILVGFLFNAMAGVLL